MKERSWLRILWKYILKCKGKMILSVLCAVISVLGGFLPYIAVYRIITLFLQDGTTKGLVNYYALLALGGYLIKLVFHTFSTILSHISAYTILEEIRLSILDKLMKAPLGTVINETVGRMKNIILDRVEVIEVPLAHVIPEMLSNLLLPIIVFIYLCTIDVVMALATLASLPIAALSIAIMMRNYNQQYSDYMKASDHVNSVIVEYTEGIEVIKAFNQSSTSYEKFVGAIEAFKDYTLNWFSSTWGLMNFSLTVLPSTLLGTVPIGLIKYMKGTLNPSQFAMCAILSLGIVGPFMKLAVFINEAKLIEYAIKDASKLLSIEELPVKHEKAKLKDYSIEYKGVSFSYDNTRVLKEVEFSMPQGSFYALVGPSGGGKSTIARLLSRFWDVAAGAITIGGVDIRNIPLKQLRDTVSFVTQDNFLFNTTLMENIRLGNPKAKDDEVFEAARAARCHDFIMDFKKGYETTAGEAGNRLSGGEKQRIAIARALLKNAPIVVLDEATAYTDPENEDKIQQSIKALIKGKTLLVIAHRLSTIKHADKIILLKDGKILAKDSHEGLIEKSNLYSDMWNTHIQSKSFIAKQREEHYV